MTVNDSYSWDSNIFYVMTENDWSGLTRRNEDSGDDENNKQSDGNIDIRKIQVLQNIRR
jgi:hypothetical protein